MVRYAALSIRAYSAASEISEHTIDSRFFRSLDAFESAQAFDSAVVESVTAEGVECVGRVNDNLSLPDCFGCLAYSARVGRVAIAFEYPHCDTLL